MHSEILANFCSENLRTLVFLWQILEGGMEFFLHSNYRHSKVFISAKVPQNVVQVSLDTEMRILLNFGVMA